MMLTFNEELHEYRWNGVAVPSVTTILKPLSNMQFVDPYILDAAQKFGTAVHKACELHDLGTLDEDALDPGLAPYLEGWKKFSVEHATRWLVIEKPMFHSVYRYAGTPDRLGMVDGCRSVVDIKSGSALFPTVGPQTAAYLNIANHRELNPFERRYAVQLKMDGTYKLEEYKDPSDWSVFMSLITLRGWCAKHSITPNFQEKK